MITVGELLIKAREKKKLSLEQVEKATKIRAKFLDAIEKNDFDKVPPGTFARGFIKNYASYLGLSESDIMAFYRRQTMDEKVKLPNPEPEELATNRIKFTPQFFTFTSVVIMLLLFFAYLIFSYFNFAGAPALSVTNPKNNTVVSADEIEVKGNVDPQATLTINNQGVNTLENGNFDLKVPLSPGLNTLTITATNKFKRQSVITRNIRLEK